MKHLVDAQVWPARCHHIFKQQEHHSVEDAIHEDCVLPIMTELRHWMDNILEIWLHQNRMAIVIEAHDLLTNFKVNIIL